jgi:hypothetical protein
MCKGEIAVGVTILQDLTAAVAGARELLKSHERSSQDPIAYADVLLAQAMDRCATLREIVHG